MISVKYLLHSSRHYARNYRYNICCTCGPTKEVKLNKRGKIKYDSIWYDKWERCEKCCSNCYYGNFQTNTKYYAKLQCTHHAISSVIYVWQTLGLFFTSILPSIFASLFHKKPRHKSTSPIKKFQYCLKYESFKKIQYLLNYHALKS